MTKSGSTVYAESGSTVQAWSGSTVYAESGSTVQAWSGSTVCAESGSTAYKPMENEYILWEI